MVEKMSNVSQVRRSVVPIQKSVPSMKKSVPSIVVGEKKSRLWLWIIIALVVIGIIAITLLI
ncbi:MAG: hypothetical protein V1889_02805 [archaeon]